MSEKTPPPGYDEHKEPVSEELLAARRREMAALVAAIEPSKTIPTEEETARLLRLLRHAANVQRMPSGGFNFIGHLFTDAVDEIERLRSQPTREAGIDRRDQHLAVALCMLLTKTPPKRWAETAAIVAAVDEFRSLELPTPEGGSNG